MKHNYNIKNKPVPNPKHRLDSTKSGIKTAILIGHLVVALIFTFDANAVIVNGAVGGGGYCLFKGDNSCAWCAGGSSPDPGLCIPDYAGCTSGVERAEGNSYYYVDNNQATTKWDCGPSGWSFISSLEKCDRYSYRNSNGECVMCPYADFKYLNIDGTLVEILPRGDYYEYKLTGCHIYFQPGQQYVDETGTFTFEPNVDNACYHSGVL